MEEIVKLDKKDKKLLYELDFHARDSYTQLAKRVGLSKQGVEYKINNLKKKGVIRGFYPIINVPKLGYIYCRLTLTLKYVNKEYEEKVVNYLKEQPKFFWVFTAQGVYDILVVMWAKTITEFKQAIDKLMEEHGQYIKSKNESITTDVIHYQHRYLLKKEETEEIHVKEAKQHITLSEDEKRILLALVEDGRMSAVHIGQKTNIPAKRVAYKIKELEKKKIIEGYRPMIDHNKIGYTYYKLWINLHLENLKEIKRLYEHIKHNPLVLYVVEGIGLPEDLDVEIMVKDNTELFSFIKDLRLNFPNIIGDYKMFIFMDTKKVRYLPF